ncbi:unnamed protein product, partial [Urochloa humidicola]
RNLALAPYPLPHKRSCDRSPRRPRSVAPWCGKPCKPPPPRSPVPHPAHSIIAGLGSGGGQFGGRGTRFCGPGAWRSTTHHCVPTTTALFTGEWLVVFLFATRVALAASAGLAAPLGISAPTATALAVKLAVNGSDPFCSPLCRFRIRKDNCLTAREVNGVYLLTFGYAMPQQLCSPIIWLSEHLDKS